MNQDELKLSVVFFRTGAGAEPVHEWLNSLPMMHKKIIGEDIKTVQFGWPLGMPLVEKIESGLWEMRSHVSSGIVRVFFTVDGRRLILLHAFVKKTQKIPPKELATVRSRLRQYKNWRTFNEKQTCRQQFR